MAGNKIRLRGKLPGSTILETVISMVIIVLVFGIAMMIYNNVLRLSLSAQKLRAQAILQEVLLQAGQNGDNSNQSIHVEEFRIEQEVKAFGNESKLSEIRLTAYDDNQQQVARLQQIVINENQQY